MVFTKVVTHRIRLHYHGNNIALTDYTASLTVGVCVYIAMARVSWIPLLKAIEGRLVAGRETHNPPPPPH